MTAADKPQVGVTPPNKPQVGVTPANQPHMAASGRAGHGGLQWAWHLRSRAAMARVPAS